MNKIQCDIQYDGQKPRTVRAGSADDHATAQVMLVTAEKSYLKRGYLTELSSGKLIVMGEVDGEILTKTFYIMRSE